MGASFGVSSVGGIVSTGTTVYLPSSNCYLDITNGTETYVQQTYRNAGVHRKLSVWVSANAASSPTYVVSRVNGANGAESVEVSDLTTGRFTDTSGEDNIASTDECCLRYVNDGGGNVSIITNTHEFEATTDTVSFWQLRSTTSTSTASTTNYYTPAGRWQGANTTANNAKIEPGADGTWENMYAYVSSNARTTNTEYRNRINASNGTMLLTYGSGATGVIEDTSHSDSVTAGDDCDLSHTTSTGTGSITTRFWASAFRTTSNKSVIVFGNSSSGAGISSATTRYLPLGGSGAWQSTENLTAAHVSFTSEASYLAGYVSANTNAAVTDIYVRVNSTDSGVTFQVGSTASGQFKDTTHSVAMAADDEVKYKGVCASGGGTVTFRNLCVTVEDTTVPPSGGVVDPIGVGVIPFAR